MFVWILTCKDMLPCLNDAQAFSWRLASWLGSYYITGHSNSTPPFAAHYKRPAIFNDGVRFLLFSVIRDQ